MIRSCFIVNASIRFSFVRLSISPCFLFNVRILLPILRGVLQDLIRQQRVVDGIPQVPKTLGPGQVSADQSYLRCFFIGVPEHLHHIIAFRNSDGGNRAALRFGELSPVHIVIGLSKQGIAPPLLLSVEMERATNRSALVISSYLPVPT